MRIEPLVDEELAPRRRAIGVQPRVARYLRLGAEEEAGVRVDQQEGVAVARPLGRNGDAVRSARLAKGEIVDRDDLGVAIERRQRRERHAFDVAADAAFGKAQRHPRREVRQHPRMHPRMVGEIVVERVGPRGHQRPEPRRRRGIAGFKPRRIDEQSLAQVGPQRRLAVGLGEAAEAGQIVRLDPREVILGLGVDHAIDRVGVGVAADVGDAPFVAGDGCAMGLRGRCRRGTGVHRGERHGNRDSVCRRSPCHRPPSRSGPIIGVPRVTSKGRPVMPIRNTSVIIVAMR